MRSQHILLMLAILAVLARDVTCKKNVSEADENEPDEEEPDENEGRHKHPMNKATSTSSVVPSSVSDIWPATFASMPTGAAAAAAASEWSDVAAVQTSVASWVSSVTYAPSTTARASRNVPLASASVYRPYAGPGVVNGSNHVGLSIGIATVGILAFLMTLVY